MAKVKAQPINSLIVEMLAREAATRPSIQTVTGRQNAKKGERRPLFFGKGIGLDKSKQIGC